MPRVLTDAEIEEITKEMVPFTEGVPVRFMHEGRNFNVTTGHLQKKGINVIHQTFYWRFTRETAKKIAELTGTKADFSK